MFGQLAVSPHLRHAAPLLTRTTIMPADYNHAPMQPRLATLPASMSVLPPSIAEDYFNIFAVLATAGAAGHALGPTRVGRALSGPVCAMAITFALTSTGVLPPASPLVGNAQLMAVQLATPLLLLSADLRAIGRRAGRLLPSFLLGTIGTTLGALCGARLFGAPLVAAFGVDGMRACAALAAKNIGGGLNFVAVAAALRLSPGAFAAALAVDNVMALVYFPLCSWLGRQASDPCGDGDDGCVMPDGTVVGESTDDENADRVGLQSRALAIALVIAAASKALAGRLCPGFDLPLSTVLTVCAATLAPRVLGPLSGLGTDLGTTCLFFFFATAGWTGGALGKALLAGGPPLLGFLTTLYAVHLALVLVVGRAVRSRLGASGDSFVALPQLLVSSNANIGGPATASALANGNGWPSLVAPALLVGNMGYAIATPLALLIYSLVWA